MRQVLAPGEDQELALPKLSVLDPQVSFPVSSIRSIAFSWLKIGIHVIFGILILFLFVWTRDKVYGWFMLFISMLIMGEFGLMEEDLWTEYIFPEFPKTKMLTGSWLTAGLFISFMQFGRVFIDLPKHFPGTDLWLRRFMWGLGIGYLLGSWLLFFELTNPFLWTLNVIIERISFLGIYFIIFRLFFAKNAQAFIFAISACILSLGFILGSIFGSKVLLASIGILVAAFIGLAYRYRFNEEEKIKALNERATQLRQINLASAKFVPSAFLHFLGKKNILDAHLGDYIEKQVNVLFLDIRDFTSLSEKMTPEENFRFINAFHRRMGPVISNHRGFVMQYLGDGIMAIFPENAVEPLQAAIEVQSTLQKYNEERTARGRVAIHTGIGIHSGPLIMGIVGDQQRLDAATISDTVNTASRIENLTKHFNANILLSEESYKKIRSRSADVFHFRFLGRFQFKGKEVPIGIYECFNGDLPQVIEKKINSSPFFEEAIALYFSRQFSESEAAFEKILTSNPEDKAARLYRDRSNQYLIHGVPDDWKGVEVMTFK